MTKEEAIQTLRKLYRIVHEETRFALLESDEHFYRTRCEHWAATGTLLGISGILLPLLTALARAREDLESGILDNKSLVEEIRARDVEIAGLRKQLADRPVTYEPTMPPTKDTITSVVVQFLDGTAYRAWPR